MAHALQIAKQTFIQGVGRALSLIIALGTVMLLTRYFGVEQYGHLTTITSYLFFFAVFAELGIYIVTSRELPLQENEERFFGNVLGLKLVASVAATVCAIIIIWFFSYPLEVKIGVCIVAAAFSFQTFSSVFASVFQYKLQTEYIAIGDVLNKVGIAIFAVCAWLFSFDMYFFLVGYIVGNVLNIWYLLRRVRAFFPVRLYYDMPVWKSILAKSWPVALSGILTIFYFRADTLILAAFHPAHTVGIYGAAYKMLEVLITFPVLFTGLLIPILSKSYETGDYERFSAIFQRAFDALSLIVFPLIVFVCGTASWLISGIAGTEFIAAAPVLRILIIATGIIFLAHLTTHSVAAVNMQRAMIRHYCIAACGALALYVVFIPHFSYFGAAWITVGVELYIFLASFFLVLRQVKNTFSFRNLVKIGCIALVSGSVFLVIPPTTTVFFFVSSGVFFGIYAIFSFAVKTVDQSVIDMLFSNAKRVFGKPQNTKL